MVKGDRAVVKRLIAERGTGLELDDEELEELDDPPLPPWLLEEDWVIAVAGVEVARLMLLLVEEDEDVLLVEEVWFPAVLVMEPAGVVDATPLLEEAFSVLTVPLEAAEVRPEVLCAAEPEPELLVP
jgi:hypothetical protein